jgi:cytochrome c
MHRTVLSLLFACCTVSPALADLALATSQSCMGCHTVDKKRVGPAFKDIAARYQADKAAADRLANTIRKGSVCKAGVCNWGPVPMPANERVSEADANKLATWVLGLK